MCGNAHDAFLLFSHGTCMALGEFPGMLAALLQVVTGGLAGAGTGDYTGQFGFFRLTYRNSRAPTRLTRWPCPNLAPERRGSGVKHAEREARDSQPTRFFKDPHRNADT